METSALSQVSDSLFLPLLCRVLESRSSRPIIRDPKSEAIYERIKPVFNAGTRPIYRQLARGHLAKLMVITVALRTRCFDRRVRDFQTRHPDGLIVNLGCGLDTRFARLDDGSFNWVDLDYPEVIQLRQHFFDSSSRYKMLPGSVLAQDWMSELEPWQGKPVLFLAEGLLMYLQPSEVKLLVQRLSSRFPGSELVAEVVRQGLVDKLQTSRYLRWKFEQQLHLGPEAIFRFGLSESAELESWQADLHYLDEWAYYDDQDPKLGILNWLGAIEPIRHLQWVVHYQLGKSLIDSDKRPS